ncbi:uncharacterized protein EV420DRAFT_568452 [Desarmillaria tabescens]|uniref:Uncharacterized protein n=1 Tax=Armillaria tabescens TaxID=1929756 RepID=A0AA39K8T2_ARMTA|nr:uncharacterized protein EV420DRAFT_568452 [Desarmillaria tabescens]KAK0455411.1 hypothetical protein EV420DRAFT_568452 [Desarmillaria tabescens]
MYTIRHRHTCTIPRRPGPHNARRDTHRAYRRVDRDSGIWLIRRWMTTKRTCTPPTTTTNPHLHYVGTSTKHAQIPPSHPPKSPNGPTPSRLSSARPSRATTTQSSSGTSSANGSRAVTPSPSPPTPPPRHPSTLACARKKPNSKTASKNSYSPPNTSIPTQSKPTSKSSSPPLRRLPPLWGPSGKTLKARGETLLRQSYRRQWYAETHQVAHRARLAISGKSRDSWGVPR